MSPIDLAFLAGALLFASGQTAESGKYSLALALGLIGLILFVAARTA
ncbi:hypothetical protein [Sphingobium yanoikuyae]|nr:hypothetical protein [Sphingobium yanoikuyae]